MKMADTKHSSIRMCQRGIPRDRIDLILEHGTHFTAYGGAVRCMITKRQIADQVSLLKREIRRWERAKGTTLIVAEDGDVITVQHQLRRHRVV